MPISIINEPIEISELAIPKQHEELIEFDSMINLRPSQGNRSRDVSDPSVRLKIKKIVSRLVI